MATQTGFLVISDISGYTMFLSKSELEHAQEILQALLELLIDHNRPPLTISRTAGDAVISYALAGAAIQGQTFVELMEDTYVAFRRAIELMVMNNSCQCNACANVSALDLKFFVHHGEFGIQKLGGHDELVGSDVNLLHRLLKNRVVEATGVAAYTLYTDGAIRALGLDGFTASLTSHRESYEHLGEVALWVQNMHPVWQAKQKERLITIPPERVVLEVSAEIALPPHQVWDYLIRPEFQSVIIGSDRQEITHRHSGRVAPGSVYVCYHGKQIIRRTILQWRPFEEIITEDLIPLPGTFVPIRYLLTPTASGTRLTQTFGKGRGPLRLLADLKLRLSAKQAQADVEKFRDTVHAAWAAQSGQEVQLL
ncbi:MAG: DUF2652 domain-containing protein [Chloroflexi bacterium]|nr:DUF2652 domain-containing protein [Chloroflexota bacterium]